MKSGFDRPLNRNLPVPLYYQIAESIQDEIRAGRLLPGDQLPSERDLSAKFNVSRMTARQAITYLVSEGALVVRHGNGTFVAEPKLTYDVPHLLGFTEVVLREGKTATSSVIEQVRVRPPASIARQLGLNDSEDAVKVIRVRQVEDTPLVLETTFIPAALCPGLESVDLSSASLYTVFEQRYGLHLHHAEQSLAARTASDFEQTLLDIGPCAPIITLEGITYLDSGQPVESFAAHYRGDRFKFAFDSNRGAFSTEGKLFEMVLDNAPFSPLRKI